MRPFINLCCLSLIFLQATAVFAQQDFTVESPTHSAKFTLSEAKGKIVVLHFLLKTECPYCLRHTRDYAQKSLGRQDVIHVFLNPTASKK